MKIFKKIIAWAMLSLILQISGLFVLDNFVFQHTSEFESKKFFKFAQRIRGARGEMSFSSYSA